MLLYAWEKDWKKNKKVGRKFENVLKNDQKIETSWKKVSHKNGKMKNKNKLIKKKQKQTLSKNLLKKQVRGKVGQTTKKLENKKIIRRK